MNETVVTVVGNVASNPAIRTTVGGARVAHFRLASTERRYDRTSGQWRDGATTFYTVTSWRTTAENVCRSVQKGQPVVVHGRFRESAYEDKDGTRRQVLEVEAYALGHDLSRGVTLFSRPAPAAAEPEMAPPPEPDVTSDAGSEAGQDSVRGASEVVAPS